METNPNATFLRRAALWTVGLAAGSAVIAGLVWTWQIALGVALGALLGLANVAMLARTLRGMVAEPERYRPHGAKWLLPGVLLLKWPLLLLALAGILWYSPARPEGVAVGVLLSLCGAAFAARVRGPSGPTGS